MRRFLSLALAFVLIISLLNIPASASVSTGLAETAKNAVGKSYSDLQLPSSNWCGYFVGYCINNSLVSSLAGEKISRTDSRNPMTLVNWTCAKKSIGTYYSLSSIHYDRLVNTYKNLSIISTTVDSFAPEAGDIIVFDWSGRNNNSQTFSHVGIVTDYTASSAKVTYVDGNSGTGYYTYVSKTTFNKNYSGIIGYIRLKTSAICTITFDPNGGSVSPSSKTITAGTTLTDMPTPTRSGYTFLGWAMDKIDPDDNGVQVTTIVSDGVFTFEKDTTLYALWKRNCTNHIYDAETCTNCGATLPYDNRFDVSAAGIYQVSADTAYIRTGPYQVKDLVRTMSKGEILQAVGSVINSYNNTWLKTTDGYYVHADKLIPVGGGQSSTDTGDNLPLFSDGVYTLAPLCALGSRLDVAGADWRDNANVQIHESNGTLAQQWELTYLGEGYYKLICKASGKALDVSQAGTESGTNVQQFTPNGTNAQQWMLKDAGKGYYYLVPRVNTDLCLDVAGAGAANGTNVGIYIANGTNAQMWKLTPVDSYPISVSGSSTSIPQYFNCNMGIFCVDGKTVNLYTNPGDSKRVDYFSLGQSVRSSYGVNMPDGTTWYQVSVTSKGNVITAWLKYESDKMTIRNLG